MWYSLPPDMNTWSSKKPVSAHILFDGEEGMVIMGEVEDKGFNLFCDDDDNCCPHRPTVTVSVC